MSLGQFVISFAGCVDLSLAVRRDSADVVDQVNNIFRRVLVIEQFGIPRFGFLQCLIVLDQLLLSFGQTLISFAGRVNLSLAVQCNGADVVDQADNFISLDLVRILANGNSDGIGSRGAAILRCDSKAPYAVFLNGGSIGCLAVSQRDFKEACCDFFAVRNRNGKAVAEDLSVHASHLDCGHASVGRSNVLCGLDGAVLLRGSSCGICRTFFTRSQLDREGKFTGLAIGGRSEADVADLVGNSILEQRLDLRFDGCLCSRFICLLFFNLNCL